MPGPAPPPTPPPRPAPGHILDAAEALFARKGLGPTTIKEIGTAAGQNPALLYYYFGSKEELYRAVLQRVVSAMVARGGAALGASPPPPPAVRGPARAPGGVPPPFAAVSPIAQGMSFTVARPAIGLFFGEGARGVSGKTAKAFAKHAGEF